MRDGQQSSRSSGGPEFDNGKKQQWVPRKDCVSGDPVLGGDGLQEDGQYNIACDDSKQQNGLPSIFNGNDATNKEEKSPYQRDAMEPVAIIGFSLRFPQDATSPQGFWDMLYQGTSAKTEVPSDRFNIKAFYHPDSSRISSVSPNLPTVYTDLMENIRLRRFRRSTSKMGTLSRTLPLSTRPSFPSHQRKQLAWIHSNEGC